MSSYQRNIWSPIGSHFVILVFLVIANVEVDYFALMIFLMLLNGEGRDPALLYRNLPSNMAFEPFESWLAIGLRHSLCKSTRLLWLSTSNFVIKFLLWTCRCFYKGSSHDLLVKSCRMSWCNRPILNDFVHIFSFIDQPSWCHPTQLRGLGPDLVSQWSIRHIIS